MAGQGKSGQPKQALGALAELVRDLRVAWGLFTDRHVPIWFKARPFLALAYILWPVDLLPDLVPALGQLDDLTILILGIAAFIGLCPVERVKWQREKIAGIRSGQETVDTTYRVLDQDPWK